MPNIYFIADLHFGHKKVLDYEPKRSALAQTIEEHDTAIIERCNRVVTKKDTLWILGDLAFNREALKKCLAIEWYQEDGWRKPRYLFSKDVSSPC